MLMVACHQLHGMKTMSPASSSTGLTFGNFCRPPPRRNSIVGNRRFAIIRSDPVLKAAYDKASM